MSYRARLRVEGLGLALCGLAGTLALLAFADGATDGPASTLIQLAVVVGLLAFFGPRTVQGWLNAAETIEHDPAGEPTPLWHLPLVVAALCVPFALLDAPDAMLRVTGGCLLVGLAQAVLFARVVARFEAGSGVVAYRLPGSRLGRGTKLGLKARPSARDL